jgi:hypothetical protein
MSSTNQTRLAELRRARDTGMLERLFKRYKKDHPKSKSPPKFLRDKAKEQGDPKGDSKDKPKSEGPQQKMTSAELKEMSDEQLAARRIWLMHSKNRRGMDVKEVGFEHAKIKAILRARPNKRLALLRLRRQAALAAEGTR